MLRRLLAASAAAVTIAALALPLAAQAQRPGRDNDGATNTYVRIGQVNAVIWRPSTVKVTSGIGLIESYRGSGVNGAESVGC